MAFTVRSNNFKDGDYLAQEHILSADYGFGCEGGNKSPHLAWSGAPAGTKSFAVTCFDPDAPTGSGFWHWVVINIPANVNELPLDAGHRSSSKLPTGRLRHAPISAPPDMAVPAHRPAIIPTVIFSRCLRPAAKPCRRRRIPRPR
jgi:hypothetical protein